MMSKLFCCFKRNRKQTTINKGEGRTIEGNQYTDDDLDDQRVIHVVVDPSTPVKSALHLENDEEGAVMSTPDAAAGKPSRSSSNNDNDITVQDTNNVTSTPSSSSVVPTEGRSPPTQDTPSTPDTAALSPGGSHTSLRKRSSLVYDVMPFKLSVIGDPFATESPLVSDTEATAAWRAIQEDPLELVGWQIEVFEKFKGQSIGIRVVNGMKKMKGQPYKFNILLPDGHNSSLPTSNSGLISAPLVSDSRDSNDNSEITGAAILEKWSELKINIPINKGGWPIKLLRKVALAE